MDCAIAPALLRPTIKRRYDHSARWQSFAVALLSENGDGAVLSSLYARDRMSVFAKPVKNFSSEFEMTEEEKEVLARARRS